jgi:hypothetical protein
VINLCLGEDSYFLWDDVSNNESFYCDDLIELVKDCLNNDNEIIMQARAAPQHFRVITKYKNVKDFVDFYLYLYPEEFI